ncbi:MAG TPA: Mu transposase C-terminal domain-containing protein [Thermosynechococcaceae cyanobacterium]
MNPCPPESPPPSANEISSGEIPAPVQARVRALESLEACRDRATYLARQREVARELGMSLRNVQRLVSKWRSEGIGALRRKARSDRGEMQVSGEWQAYIVQTYRAGNRGGRRMSRAQVSVRVQARAQEQGQSRYPSRASVYRVLEREIERSAQQQRQRSIGWSREALTLRTRDGLEIQVTHSNQVWQCDHTKLDVLVVDPSGANLGRPWLSTVIDTYSRCMIGMHLGMEAPSAVVVCLALRHAILPKQYSSSYELTQAWGTYGIPQYLYTDGGKDFSSKHLEQVCNELKIVLCQRRYPAEGGIVERPFGTLNSELLSSLPGYTGSHVKQRPKQAESAASLTLEALEKHLVRYLVERYNPSLDARNPDQSRAGRWENGLLGVPRLLGERELDLCLMRRDRRVIYRGGYIQFANLSYQGEHLAGYAGESVVLRYNPRDITSVLIYQEKAGSEHFLSRAHALGLETERLAYAEAQAMSRRIRAAGRAISNPSILQEVQRRDQEVNQQRRARQSPRPRAAKPDLIAPDTSTPASLPSPCDPPPEAPEPPPVPPTRPVPNVVVYDYEELKRNYGKW